jgi:hypothetical protein
VATLAVAASAGLLSSHAQSPEEQAPISLPDDTSTIPKLPSAQPPTVVQEAKPAAPASANSVAEAKAVTVISPAEASQREIEAESSDLLKMATALKAEVDKSTKDTLSVTVVRKAGEIEQLAHKVRLGTGKG